MRHLHSAFVQLLTHIWLFAIPCTAAHQASLSFTISQSLLKLMSIESVQWTNPTISSSVIPFSSCPQSFPASGSFPMNWLFTSGGQSTGASASVSMFRVDFLYDWLVWSPCYSRDSQESLAPRFESSSSLTLSLLYGPTLTSVHDYWKNHSFDYTDFYQMLNVKWNSNQRRSWIRLA